MNTYTCQEHSDDVVVFHGMCGDVCPLCTANTVIADLEQQVEDLTGERDSLQSELEDAQSEADSAESRADEAEARLEQMNEQA